MKLGIDFGTTDTVVSVVDRGNYPIVSFCTTEGDWMDYYPSLIAVNGDEFLYGFEAQSVNDDPNWVIIRSIKSYLKTAFKNKTITIRGKVYYITELLTSFLKHFHEDLIHQSNLELESDQFSVSIAVPAHSNNAQRFLIAECFVNADFDVLNIINEPSAATMEYVNSFYKRVDLISKKYLFVYDLGGGTFDASIAEIHDTHHKIIATEGLDTLGGDQFDAVLADMIKEKFPAGIKLDFEDEVRLLEQCKLKKESLTPYSRVILIEWRHKDKEPEIFKLSVKDYYARCEPLVEKTVDIIEKFISRIKIKESFSEFSSLYLVGGMSNFPLINRKIKNLYGKSRVRKSLHCESAVAIGLASLMDRDHDFLLKESLTRNFGLWREAEEGQNLAFDIIFHKDQLLPAKGELPIVFTRQYSPTHNIGVFRFQECSYLDDGRPKGLVSIWNKIMFPFEEALENKRLDINDVKRYAAPADFTIKELYFLNYKGEISVQIINTRTQFTQTFQLSRMESRE